MTLPAEGLHLENFMLGQERRYIEAALDAAGGVQKKAAELLHLKPTTLNEKIKRYDIRTKKKKGNGEEGAGEDESTNN